MSLEDVSPVAQQNGVRHSMGLLFVSGGILVTEVQCFCQALFSFWVVLFKEEQDTFVVLEGYLLGLGELRKGWHVTFVCP